MYYPSCILVDLVLSTPKYAICWEKIARVRAVLQAVTEVPGSCSPHQLEVSENGSSHMVRKYTFTWRLLKMGVFAESFILRWDFPWNKPSSYGGYPPWLWKASTRAFMMKWHPADFYFVITTGHLQFENYEPLGIFREISLERYVKILPEKNGKP